MASRVAAAKPRDKPGPRVVSKITGKALVKGVLSGDTLLIVGNSKPGEGPAPEKEITLSGIRAPLFARGKSGQDENWAWHSREFLRKKVLGKPIVFQIVHRHEASGRDYCNVQFNGEELTHIVVANGWAKVNRPNQEVKKVHPEKQALLDLENEAQAQGLGIWSKNIPEELQIREIDWVENISEFYEKKKNIPLTAVVDKVITGSVLRVEILGDEAEPQKHYMINLHLAGVECPETPKPDSVLQAEYASRKAENPDYKPPKRQKPFPFAIEAQKFVENRLLHRDIKIVLQGTDKQVLFGSIIFEKGNITEKLLEQGLGKYVKWTANLTGAGDRLAMIESESKKRKVGKWHSHQEGDDVKGGSKATEIQAKVTQIISGDRFVVEGDKRYALASIRAPKFGTRGDPGEPLGFEAREELRKAVIGKTVKIVIEYERDPPVDSRFQDKQVFVSLYHGKTNLQELLIEKGLAQVMHHKRNEDRASNYDRLVEKEAKARKEGRGRWAEPVPTPRSFMDLTQNFRARPVRKPRGKEEGEEGGEEEHEEQDEKETKRRPAKSQARAQFELLKQGKQNGIVEYVFSSTRYKILLEGRGLFISFALSGVRSPPQKNSDGSDNIYSQKALDLARNKLLQRTVQFEIRAMDRGDNFLGSLWYQDLSGPKEKKENFGHLLLREGLAQTFGPNVQPDLLREEKLAKDQKLNFWQDYVEPPPEEQIEDDYAPEEEEEKGEEKAEEQHPQKGRARGVPAEATVRVTEVIDAATFYVHITSDPATKEIEEQMGAFDGASAVAPADGDVKNGIYAGLFKNDGSWHRVRIEGKSAGGKWRAFFIDYGNRDVLDLEDIRVLDEDLVKLPGTAHSCVLTGLKAPGDRSEYFERAGQAFSDLVWDRQLQAKIDLIEGGKYYVTLKQPGSDLSVNQKLLQAGCVRLQDKFPRGHVWKPVRDAVNKLRELEDQAKRYRRGIWEYGDVSDEEEELFDDRGRVPSKAAKEKAEKEKAAKKEKEKEAAAAKKKAEEEKAKAKGDKGKGKGGDKGGDKAAAGGDKGKAGDKGAAKGGDKGGKKK